MYFFYYFNLFCVATFWEILRAFWVFLATTTDPAVPGTTTAGAPRRITDAAGATTVPGPAATPHVSKNAEIDAVECSVKIFFFYERKMSKII